MALKDEWKKTGTGLGHAFRDLGKTVIKSVKTGAEKADNWANSEDNEKAAFCHACGAKAGDGDFCPACGTKLK